ncbi:MAG: hypothetical protein ACI9HY_000786 [Planctomycetaceae bacterium]|jgi:hypothetical protein
MIMIKAFLKKLFSSRLWVTALIGLGVYTTFNPLPEQVDPNHIIIGALIVAVVTILLVSYAAFSIEGVEQYVLDVSLDAFITAGAIIAATVIITGHYLSDWSFDGLWYLIIAVTLGAVDFGVSLKGGAAKLHEMDKQNILGTGMTGWSQANEKAVAQK